MARENKEYTVSSELLPAIINGDYSGLEFYSPDDAVKLREWLAEHENAQGHWSTEEDGSNWFGWCEILKTRATVETLNCALVGFIFNLSPENRHPRTPGYCPNCHLGFDYVSHGRF